MSTSVLISSNNFSGQTANITFYPDTGGTQSLGSHVLPVTLSLDYYYGTYNLYFSAYPKTCIYILTDDNYLLQEDFNLILQEDTSLIIIEIY